MDLQVGQQVTNIVFLLRHTAERIVNCVVPQQGVQYVAHAGGQHVQLVATL